MLSQETHKWFLLHGTRYLQSLPDDQLTRTYQQVVQTPSRCLVLADRLPPVLLRLICTYLSLPCLIARVRGVCKHFRAVSMERASACAVWAGVPDEMAQMVENPLVRDIREIREPCPLSTLHILLNRCQLALANRPLPKLSADERKYFTTASAVGSASGGIYGSHMPYLLKWTEYAICYRLSTDLPPLPSFGVLRYVGDLEPLKPFLGLMPNLEHMGCIIHGKGDVEIVRSFGAHFPQLRSVALRVHPVDADRDAVRALNQLTNLTSVELTNVFVSPALLSEMSGLSQLRRLSLRHSGYSAFSLAALAPFPLLESLQFEGPALHLDSPVAFTRLTELILVHVELVGTGTGFELDQLRNSLGDQTLPPPPQQQQQQRQQQQQQQQQLQQQQQQPHALGFVGAAEYVHLVLPRLRLLHFTSGQRTLNPHDWVYVQSVLASPHLTHFSWVEENGYPKQPFLGSMQVPGLVPFPPHESVVLSSLVQLELALTKWLPRWHLIPNLKHLTLQDFQPALHGVLLQQLIPPMSSSSSSSPSPPPPLLDFLHVEFAVRYVNSRRSNLDQTLRSVSRLSSLHSLVLHRGELLPRRWEIDVGERLLRSLLHLTRLQYLYLPNYQAKRLESYLDSVWHPALE